jgi:hypothetical protein
VSTENHEYLLGFEARYEKLLDTKKRALVKNEKNGSKKISLDCPFRVSKKLYLLIDIASVFGCWLFF